MCPRFVTIEGRSLEAMRDLIREHHVEVIRHSLKMQNERLTVEAVIDPDMCPALAAAGYAILESDDLDEDPRLGP